MGNNRTSKKFERNSAFVIKNANFIESSAGNYELYIRITKENISKFVNMKQKNIKNKNLTKRELEVLKELTNGKTNSQIATDLIVTKHTIKAHVSNIIRKMQVENRQQAAMKALVEKMDFV